MDTTDWWGAHLLHRGRPDTPWARVTDPVPLGRLRERVAEARALLAAEGVRRGSSVALQMPPGLTVLQVMLATWSLGAQVMLLDPRLKQAETDRLLARCEPQFLITSPQLGQVVAGIVESCDVVVAARASGRPAQDEVCLVQFSSGSTGLPKVIGRTPQSLLAELDSYTALAGMPGAGERIVLLNSVLHTMGLIGGVLHGLNAGVEIVLPPRAQPSDILRAAVETRAEAVFGVPVHFDLLSRVTSTPLPALRVAVSAGEVLAHEVYDRFAETYDVAISPVYGSTETGIIAADLAGSTRPPGVGTPVSGIAVREADGGLEVALARSPYLLDDGVDRYRDGWLRTFDRCRIDAVTGALEILGRADSVAVVGGLKVDLVEVEAVLREHPAVHEAVVLAGDVIEAHVGCEPQLESGELVRWCRERLSDYKVPRRFYPGPAVPRNSNGKIIRSRELLHAAYATSGS
ncbi:class I adenylate-forming enzyme family protein [Streptomyces melanogenes]|uniref:class I adenylate-forming enzyme family protein n=1 Tax=Streptomyces melanogenes TaxID=67326 RepID=UPI00167E9471|nr:class I adenylate-forming enzyme family protein [Streptomyces melanogenes]GGP84001.1 long-chain-fatty-acid--CoA ligase [Streptomyces melanogenes]